MFFCVWIRFSGSGFYRHASILILFCMKDTLNVFYRMFCRVLEHRWVWMMKEKHLHSENVSAQPKIVTDNEKSKRGMKFETEIFWSPFSKKTKRKTCNFFLRKKWCCVLPCTWAGPCRSRLQQLFRKSRYKRDIARPDSAPEVLLRRSRKTVFAPLGLKHFNGLGFILLPTSSLKCQRNVVLLFCAICPSLYCQIV